MYICIETVTTNTFCITRIHMIYIHTHALAKPRGGWGNPWPPWLFKIPITLLKKSQIRQKNLSLAPLEKLDFITGCTNFLTSPIKVKPNQAKLIQNTQK